MLNVIEIKDFNAPELDIYARCTEARLLNKDHPEEGMFISESPKVMQVMSHCLFLLKRSRWKRMKKQARL